MNSLLDKKEHGLYSRCALLKCLGPPYLSLKLQLYVNTQHILVKFNFNSCQCVYLNVVDWALGPVCDETQNFKEKNC